MVNQLFYVKSFDDYSSFLQLSCPYRHALSFFFFFAHPDINAVQKSIVHHVTTTLARAAYNMDNFSAYQAVALRYRRYCLIDVCMTGKMKLITRV